MKQLKFLMIAATLLMGISLTSCIGDGDPTVTNVTFGKVTESFPRVVIETPWGIKFTAVNDLTSMNLFDGDYIYFQYSYNSDLVDRNTKNIDATIALGEKMTNRSAVIAADNGEDYENVTILQMGDGAGATSNYGNSGMQFLYYDKGRLILPLVFLVKEASKESVERHEFTLVYNEDAVKNGDSEIVFYLRHNSSETDVKKAVISYKTFDMSEALERFATVAGKKPERVVIYANETSDKETDNLDKKKDVMTKYSVEYDFKD